MPLPAQWFERLSGPGEDSHLAVGFPQGRLLTRDFKLIWVFFDGRERVLTDLQARDRNYASADTDGHWLAVRLALDTRLNGKFVIYLWNLDDNSDPVVIGQSTPNGQDVYPSRMSDVHVVAGGVVWVQATDGSFAGQLHRFDPATGKTTVLRRHTGYDIAVFGDELIGLDSAIDAPWRPWKIDARTGAEVPGEPTHPRPSCVTGDGAHLYLASINTVYVQGRDDKELRPLFADPNGGYIYYPVASDGYYVYFDVNKSYIIDVQSGSYAIYQGIFHVGNGWATGYYQDPNTPKSAPVVKRSAPLSELPRLPSCPR